MCCSRWGCKELDTIERLKSSNNTESSKDLMPGPPVWSALPGMRLLGPYHPLCLPPSTLYPQTVWSLGPQGVCSSLGCLCSPPGHPPPVCFRQRGQVKYPHSTTSSRGGKYMLRPLHTLTHTHAHLWADSKYLKFLGADTCRPTPRSPGSDVGLSARVCWGLPSLWGARALPESFQSR